MNFNLADIYKQVIITYKDSEKINFDKTMLFFSVYRYLSFPITAVFIWLGISANITSLIGFILLLISFYLFLFCSFDFNTLALCLFLFAYILDFVDGNIARYHTKSNFFGKLIDGFVDYISYLIFIPLAVANVKTENSLFGNQTEIYLSICTVLFAYIYMYFRLRIAFLNFELQQTNDSLRASQEIILDKNFRWYFSRIMENIMTMMPVVILLGYVTNNISYSILFYFVYFGIFGTVEILARIFIFYKTGNVNRSK